MGSTGIILATFFAAFAFAHVNASSHKIFCNKGQEYWCRNLKNAAQCNALKHCIHAVWEKEIPIEVDKSTVCQSCMDMVKLARDKLQSNETEEELRQVLEGTCKIIPTRALRRECDKVMDDAGSYIVDTLSSEMNPEVVCSVAGLCNNPKFAKLKKKASRPELDCDNCHALMYRVEENIETANTKDLYTVLAGLCGRMGSFSDVCSSLISEHMDSVDALIRVNIKAKPICSFAGVCSSKFHNHHVSVSSSSSNVRVLKNVELSEDLECDFCKQLVGYLKGVLVANTTEDEFKMVIEGFCKMSKFKDQCDQIIDEYYTAIYQFLVKELNGDFLCGQIGLCNATTRYVRPLIVVKDEKKEPAQLPIERIVNPLTLVPNQSGEANTDPVVCSFCEYFLHFIQQEITLPSSEKELAVIVEKGCAKLPATVIDRCNSFVESYMPTFVALLANKIDPSQVCPNLGVCPSYLFTIVYKTKPTCPLCLLGVEETLRKIKNKTEEEITDALDDLCLIDVFPTTLTMQCAKFASEYKKQLTDMIMADFTAQEACVYINLCDIPASFISSTTTPKQLPEISFTSGDPETNEIRENNGEACVLCEFIMSKLDADLKNKTTEEEIKAAIKSICNRMPKTVSGKCVQFIDQYADLLLDLLEQEMEPKSICTALNLCAKASSLVIGPVKKCIACELLMDGLRTVMTDKDVDDDLNKNLLKACSNFPDRQLHFCKTMVSELAPQIEAALRTLPVGPIVCRRIGMCQSERDYMLRIGGTQCYFGPSYWCSNTVNAAQCQQIEYCQKNVWMSDKPRVSHNKGSVIF